MPPAVVLSRAWILLAVVAGIAYAACATGAAPCSIAKPLGLSASMIAAALLMFVPDPASGQEPEPPESEFDE